MNRQRVSDLVEKTWNESILPVLQDYIRIPAKSPDFDADWAANGYMDQAVALARKWCEAQGVEGLQIETHQLEGRTPVLLLELPSRLPADAPEARKDDVVLLYGHLDKQPEMEGWDEGLGPWEPVVRDDKLYGRGGADDGYAVFASVTALRALQQAGGQHARCVVLIECCEESGSYDLPAYLDHFADRIGTPSLVVCLDSGAGNFEQLWCTTSLRGTCSGDLEVEVLTEGVHSGDAGGVVPSSFRIARQLLSRIEDEETGELLPRELYAPIPEDREEQAQEAGEVIGDVVWDRFPRAGELEPFDSDPAELILARTWLPTLEVIAAEGIPGIGEGGNVLRPKTTLRLSLRLPPPCDPQAAFEALREEFETEPPHNANVRFTPAMSAEGWNAPPLAPWLEKAAEQASQDWFGKPCLYIGEGGSIPFMALLGAKFPGAQFFITGVLGPNSNAHGPNEFLHLGMVKKVTGAVATLLDLHAQREH
jgi:acetylornithine deacetylase/succinyl-diaminopimelate desuccinylase-like protein